MDKNSLKKVIKPLIKECLREVLMEEGLVKVIKEYNTHAIQEPASKKQAIQRKPQQKQINEGVTLGGFDIFAGTKPIPKEGEHYEEDGVDIGKLINNNQDSWFQHLGNPNKKESVG